MDTGYKILIADDDMHIAELVALYMEKEGYETIEAHTGREAVEMFKKFDPDVVLLDIMMPDGDGYQVCREIRQISKKPIIMMSAKGEVFDKVLGLEMGADDYIVKPFDSRELVARTKSVLRRSVQKQEDDAKKIILHDLVINQSTYTVTYKNQEIVFPPKEFEVLSFLAKYPNQVFKREELLDKIWGYEFIGDTRTVDVHIKRIRAKLPKNDYWSLKTVWGVGYKFEVREQ
ncbi:MAG: response regulator transcription factor [Firmicutes bacterium]|nr:response regulator transcription factor [Bacillota bacterium]